MKSQHLLCVTLLLFCLNPTHEFIMERVLSKEEMVKSFFDGVKESTEKIFADNGIVFKPNTTGEFNYEYHITGKDDAHITINREANKVIIDMKNQYEEFNVTSENMSYEKQQTKIEDEFLKPFITHLKEIVPDAEAAFMAIKEALNGYEAEVSEGKNFTVKSCEKMEDKSSEDFIMFECQVDGEGMEDGILGQLEVENRGFKLLFVTKYFKNEFILNVRTQHYLGDESKNLMKKILLHMEKMIRLNEGTASEDPTAEQTLEQDEVIKRVQDFFEGYKEKVEGLNVNNTDNGVEASTDEPALVVNTKTEAIGDFTFINVEATMPQLGDKKFSQNFLTNSLYQMTGLLDAYLENIGEYLVHSLNSSNPEEFVAAFDDEIKDRMRVRVLEGVISKKTQFKLK